MADVRAAKLRRLNGFRRALPHVTASALEAVLNAVESLGVPELHLRANMLEATLAELEVGQL
jgi:DNA-binding HxlR family transcriptional regulator